MKILGIIKSVQHQFTKKRLNKPNIEDAMFRNIQV